MTTAELLAALAKEYPNGVSFDPMAVRLLRKKVSFEDSQLGDLKSEMFQLESGLWFSREMISDDESRLAFSEQATEWLAEYGCFSVEQLLKRFCGVLRHLVTPADCAGFLQCLGFTVDVWRNGRHFCFLPPASLKESLSEISEAITEWLDEADGTLNFHEIELEMPSLTAEALEDIRAQFLPEVHVIEVGGVLCWCGTEAIHLPEDFSEKLTDIVDTLVAIKEKVSVANLEFALNLLYRIRFREESALLDNNAFMRVCAKNYRGENEVFLNYKKPCVRAGDLSVPGKRVRSPNTRFSNLGVPIGATLVFTKESNITCTVLDGVNKVGYGGKAWSISALAMYLLDVSVVNGFAYFDYEDETLQERRFRLEQKGKQGECQTEEAPPPAEVRREGDGIIKGFKIGNKHNSSGSTAKTHREGDSIIGLDGRTLLPSTWRDFRRDGTNPRVAEWVRRVEEGERVEQIVLESGYAVTTVKNMISNYRLYFKVCKKNGIVPEGGTNV